MIPTLTSATEEESSTDELFAQPPTHAARRTPKETSAAISTITSATDGESSTDEVSAQRPTPAARHTPTETSAAIPTLTSATEEESSADEVSAQRSAQASNCIPKDTSSDRGPSPTQQGVRCTSKDPPFLIPTLTPATDDDSSTDERLAARSAHELRPRPSATPDGSVVEVPRQTLSTARELCRQGVVTTSSSDAKTYSCSVVALVKSIDSDLDSGSPNEALHSASSGAIAAAISGSSSGSPSSDNACPIGASSTRNIKMPTTSTQTRPAPARAIEGNCSGDEFDDSGPLSVPRNIKMPTASTQIEENCSSDEFDDSGILILN